MSFGCRHVGELKTSGNHFYPIFDAKMLVKFRENVANVLGEHSKVIIFVHLAVIVDQVYGKYNYNEEEDYSHNRYMILLLDQKLRKCNSNIERASTIRVTVFEASLFSFLVSETLVSFGNYDKFSTSLRVIRISIRMIKKC